MKHSENFLVMEIRIVIWLLSSLSGFTAIVSVTDSGDLHQIKTQKIRKMFWILFNILLGSGSFRNIGITFSNFPS